jgi:hypothetical protein
VKRIGRSAVGAIGHEIATGVYPQDDVPDLEPAALAQMLKDAGGIPRHGSQRSAWDAGCRLDFANPDYR